MLLFTFGSLAVADGSCELGFVHALSPNVHAYRRSVYLGFFEFMHQLILIYSMLLVFSAGLLTTELDFFRKNSLQVKISKNDLK